MALFEEQFEEYAPLDELDVIIASIETSKQTQQHAALKENVTGLNYPIRK